MFRIRLRDLQMDIARMKRRSETRVTELKARALGELRKQVESNRSMRDSLLAIRNEEREQFAKDRAELTAQIVELASRPPILLPPQDPIDIAAVVNAIGESLQKVTYGPVRQPFTEEEVRKQTLNLVGDLNGTAGVKEGEWMPDVELDEWMETHGMPDRPGAVAGTGPPQMSSTPDTYMDTGGEGLPPAVVGLPHAARATGDEAVFRSGVGATSAPPGRVE